MPPSFGWPWRLRSWWRKRRRAGALKWLRAFWARCWVIAAQCNDQWVPACSSCWVKMGVQKRLFWYVLIRHIMSRLQVHGQGVRQNIGILAVVRCGWKQKQQTLVFCKISRCERHDSGEGRNSRAMGRMSTVVLGKVRLVQPLCPEKRVTNRICQNVKDQIKFNQFFGYCNL